MLQIVPLIERHYKEVAAIYRLGLETGIATFETAVPDWENWDRKFIKKCRFVAIMDKEIVGWSALSEVSKRDVYKGVAEDSIYVSASHQGKGVGKKLLKHLIAESEREGFWTLQAGIFSENKISIKLHEDCGFRLVGIRERVAQRNGYWHDNVVLERRSKKVNYMKNVLVLCTGNSCRSQMAQGYLEAFANGKARIYSAGIETHGLNPGALAIMKEDGIDISSHTSNHINEYEGISWDYIITVCDHANENCPFIAAPKALRLHHNFFDPSKVTGTEDEKHAAFLQAREEIKAYCKNFTTQYLVAGE